MCISLIRRKSSWILSFFLSSPVLDDAAGRRGRGDWGAPADERRSAQEKLASEDADT